MSTRGNICIKIKKEDYDKVNNIIGEFGKTISDKSPYLFIYNHHDSYPEWLGKQLLKNYNSYDKALALVIQGDCSAPGVPYTSRGEEYDHNCPRVTDSYENALEEEFLYVFEDNKWIGFDFEMNKIDF